MVVNMAKEPVRLHKVQDNISPFEFLNSWVLLHPAVIVIGMGIFVLIVSALAFAATGHSAVESGGMRNFIAGGV